MAAVFLLLLLCGGASSATHSLSSYFSGSFGVSQFPQFVGVVMLDGVEVIYCDSHIERAQPRQAWMRRVTEDDPGHVERYDECAVSHSVLNSSIHSLMQRLNQSGGIHVFQRTLGCEWDDETGQVSGRDGYAYDGEDFAAFDSETQTWRAAAPQAELVKQRWDGDEAGKAELVSYLTKCCPDRLRTYVDYGRGSLLRTDLPSVSLLQKSPSSPVRCHATGFYPDRAEMLWRKDGEELHEDVDRGEILSNHDGTFQMSVDLKLSSDKPEDWSRYECVFQLSGVKDDIVSKLDRAEIRTNQESSGVFRDVGGVVIFAVVVIGICVCKKVDDLESDF